MPDRPKRGGKADEVELPADVDPAILAAIKLVVQQEVSAKLETINKSLQELVTLNRRIADLEQSMQHTSDRLESVVSELLPAITQNLSSVSQALAMHNDH